MKTSNKLLLIFLGAIVFLMIASLIYIRFFGFEAGEKIQVSGVMTTQERALTSFSSVEFEGPFDITILQGNESTMSVTADEQIQPFITSEYADNGTLLIRIKKGYDLPNRSDIRIQITAPSWKGISLSGSGDLRSSDTLTGDFLNIESNGSGEMDLLLNYQSVTAELNGSPELSMKGSSNSLAITSNGSGEIDAMGLVCQSVSFLASGSTDAELYADSSLNVTVNGSGNVLYSGNASDVKSRMNGSGQLSRK